MLRQVQSRGEAAIVYDPAVSFVKRFYNPSRGDVILNSLDKRCPYWGPADKLRSRSEAKALAASLFQPPRTPETLSDLQSASIAAKGDLVASLRDQVSSWPRESWLLACHLVLIVFFPTARDAAHGVEALETRVFVTNPTVGEIGEILGIWQLNNGVPGHLIGGTIDHQRLDHVALVPLNPTFA